MKSVKVLVVDDSVIYRSQISSALKGVPGIDLAGVASNGRLALERLSHVGGVDLMVLDLEMPELDGLGTLQALKTFPDPPKVIVFSSTSRRGAELTMDALLEGASDFIAKPGPADVAQAGSPQERIRDLLLPRIQSLFPAAFTETSRPSFGSVSASVDLSHLRPEVLLIGSSTGGPTVLEKIFTGIRGCSINAPILMVQHMPPVFTEALATRLHKASGIPVYEAKHRQRVESGSAYLAPGGFHMRLVSTEGRHELRLDEGPLVNFVRPAVDPLFETAVSIFGKGCLGVILTGMGMDGREGARAVKRAGGAVIIQDEKSAVVYGMPGAVRAAGAFDAVMTPDQMIEYLRELATRGQYRGEAKGA
jgi:two-component system chemotaxis response regulator CheB